MKKLLLHLTIVAFVLLSAGCHRQSSTSTTTFPPAPTTNNIVATHFTPATWNESNGFGSFSTGPTGNIYVLVSDPFTGSLVATIRVSRIFPDPSAKLIPTGSNYLVWNGTNYQTWDGLNYLVWSFPDQSNPYIWPVSRHKIQQ